MTEMRLEGAGVQNTGTPLSPEAPKLAPVLSCIPPNVLRHPGAALSLSLESHGGLVLANSKSPATHCLEAPPRAPWAL